MDYIYFGAEWCAPCKQIKPLVMSSGKQIQILDVDSNQELAKKYQVRSVPTIVGIEGDTVVDRYSGQQQIQTFLK